MDSSLQKFVNDGRPVGDYLSNGIEVSGKLLLLDKMLQVVKRKQLRVLIVIQDIQVWNLYGHLFLIVPVSFYSLVLDSNFNVPHVVMDWIFFIF